MGGQEHADTSGDGGFQALFRRLPAAVIVSSTQGLIVDVNDAMIGLVGFTREEMIGQTSAGLRLYRVDERDRAFALLESQGYLRDAPLQLRTKSGELRDVIISAERIEMAGEQRHVATFLDTTDRRRIDIELLRAEERFRLLVSSVRDYAIYMLDPEGRVRSWNAGAANIKGYSDAEIAGQSFTVFFAPEDVEAGKPQALLRTASETGRAEDEGWRVRKDGSRFWANAVLTAMRDETGALQGFAKVTRDMSERRATEARLSLAARMSSVGTLAAGIAHEINNPLAYVLSNLELLAEEVPFFTEQSPIRGAAIAAMVTHACQGAERVRQIVRGLHPLSRADAERRVPVDVRTALDLSANITLRAIGGRARFVKDYGEVPLVTGDEARLGQVFINLLVNAVQSISEGNIDGNQIKVVTRTDAAGRAIIEVEDTGCGIRPEILGRIFDPFFTTKPGGEGTGLGLSICHGVVGAHGGEITAENLAGGGSRFRVVLPARLEDQAGAAATPAPLISGPAPRRGHVMVVDDDAMVGAALRNILIRDHDVTVVLDGQDALDLLLAGTRFDVILCDLMMANLTGMDFHARVMSTLPDIVARVIFMSGGAFTAEARAFLDTVPNERFEKPFATRAVRALVNSMVR